MESKVCLVYNTQEFSKLLDGLEVSPFMKLKQTSGDQFPDEVALPLGELSVSEKLFCSFCNVAFTDQLHQRQHYKLDWHRYNLKLHLAQRKGISEEKFAQLADDLSSISGSESESETEDSLNENIQPTESVHDDRLSHLIARRSRVLFNNSLGNVISLNRCLLLNKKEDPVSDEYLVDLVRKLPIRATWLIVMLGGGHFAASIFKGGEPILHKTFHSYTVRKQQGGSQAGKDGKGTHAKSAGSSLRRYNENSLTLHVQSVLKTWGPEINKCDYIFYRAVGRGNQTVLFGGTNAPLQRQDPRVRTVPFTTRRPTFNELKRVYQLLATVFVYDSNEVFKAQFSPVKVVKDAKPIDEETEKPVKVSSPRKLDRGKERPSPDRQLPQIVQDLAAQQSTSDSDSLTLEEFDQEVSFSGLQEYECVMDENCRSKIVKRKKKKKEKKAVEKETIRPQVQQFWSRFFGACESNDLDSLKSVLESRSELTNEEVIMVINQKNYEGQTVLHKMASESKGDFIKLLMHNGADPCIRDKKSLTPYDLCLEKNTRNVFRRFMGEFPDLYDYSKSHIPSALTDSLEAEMMEKKRALRKVKRQKEKEKKQVQGAQKQEEEEKKRFLALSDREKRALAAERRLLATPSSNVPTSRCFLCGADMTGRVPFEYDNNRFCSMPCLKAHRVQKVTS